MCPLQRRRLSLRRASGYLRGVSAHAWVCTSRVLAKATTPHCQVSLPLASRGDVSKRCCEDSPDENRVPGICSGEWQAD